MHSDTNGYAHAVLSVNVSILHIINRSQMPNVILLDNAMCFASQRENDYYYGS
jgi:hypothetical protein